MTRIQINSVADYETAHQDDKDKHRIEKDRSFRSRCFCSSRGYAWFLKIFAHVVIAPESLLHVDRNSTQSFNCRQRPTKRISAQSKHFIVIANNGGRE